MFPLRRQAVVPRHHRPAILQAAHLGAALVEHRLNGKHHAFTQFEPGTGAAEVQDLRVLVHLAANAMPAIFTHHAVAVALGMVLDGVADIPQACAGLDLADAGPHRFKGHFHQAPGLGRDIADHVHLAGVGDIAAFLQGDVDVDDVAVLEHGLGAGHAMAHHLVDRGIDAEGGVVLAQARRS
eukprot:gene18762-biopygen10162